MSLEKKIAELLAQEAVATGGRRVTDITISWMRPSVGFTEQWPCTIELRTEANVFTPPKEPAK